VNYPASGRDHGRGLLFTVTTLAFHERHRILALVGYRHFQKGPAVSHS